MVYIDGWMVKNIEVNGNMDNNMVKEYMLLWMGKVEEENGVKVNQLNG